MIQFQRTNPFVTGIEAAAFEAQRKANQLLTQMPHPNVRTPEGLAVLRTLGLPPHSPTTLTPVDVTMQGPGGDIRLHVFTPKTPVQAVLLRIHGGGWASGAPETDEALNDQIARACSVVIVSPDYRLVPDVTVREQIDDCVAAAHWVAAESEKRFGTQRLLLAGMSAGAHLAVATLLRLRDALDPAFDRIEGAHLDCGAYDLSGTPSVRGSDEKTLILTHDMISGIFDIGLPGISAEGRRDPALSPLYADLARLPPALFTVGALDPLLDDTLFLSARWQAAGNQASVDVWPEAAHAFTILTTPLASYALERTTSFISTLLARSGASS